MRVALVLALAVSSLVFPLQAASAAPSATVDVDFVVGIAQLDAPGVVVIEGQSIVVHLPRADKTLSESGIVNLNGETTHCTSVVVSGCPEPTSAVLSSCDDALTYTVTPGGAGVGTVSNDGGLEATVLKGSITLSCSSVTIPPPTATAR